MSAMVPDFVIDQLFSGYVNNIKCGRVSAEIQLESWIGFLTRQMPRHVFSTGCRWTLFDPGCQLIQSSFQHSGTVSSVVSDASFSLSAGVSAGYFALGQIQFTTGANAPFSRAVVSDFGPPTNRIIVRIPFPFQIHVGDSYIIFPGCDKTTSTCQNKFGNLVNFGGFPYVPPPEISV